MVFLTNLNVRPVEIPSWVTNDILLLPWCLFGSMQTAYLLLMWNATQLWDHTLALGVSREGYVGSHAFKLCVFGIFTSLLQALQMDLVSMSENYNISLEQLRKSMVTCWKWYDFKSYKESSLDIWWHNGKWSKWNPLLPQKCAFLGVGKGLGIK